MKLSFSLHLFPFFHHIENGTFGGELSPQSEGCCSSKSIGPPTYSGARDLSEVRIWPGPCPSIQRQHQPPTAGLGQVPGRAGYQGTLCPGSNTRYGLKKKTSGHHSWKLLWCLIILWKPWYSCSLLWNVWCMEFFATLNNFGIILGSNFISNGTFLYWCKEQLRNHRLRVSFDLDI